MTDELRIKIQNERVKLLSSALNTIGMAMLISAFVFPAVRESDLSSFANFLTWVWIFVGFILHIWAQALLGLLKSED